MYKRLLFLSISFLLALPMFVLAQLPIIYNENTYPTSPTSPTQLNAGNNSTVSVTNANLPTHGGSYHCQINYTAFYNSTTNASNPANFGFNLDGFYKKPYADFSAYKVLRIAYRGLGANDKLEVRLRDRREPPAVTLTTDVESNKIRIADATPNYQVVDIPLELLTLGSSVGLSQISEIRFDIYTTDISGTSTNTLFLDDIELLTTIPPATTASATTTRYNSLKKGFDASNWLEASWDLPANYVAGLNSGSATYPDVTLFTRETFKALKNAGFDHVRLPVIFEHLSSQTPPYDWKDTRATMAVSYVDNAIAWAKEFGMKIIIDNHNNMNDKMPSNPMSENLTNFNFSNNLKKAFIKGVWQKVITRYKDEPVETVLFEISNEPHGLSNANWRDLTNDIITNVIRPIEAGNTHTFLIGANDYSSVNGLMTFKPIDDKNIIYTFHTYDPYEFTHQGLVFSGVPYISTGKTYSLTGSDHKNLQKSFNLAKLWSQIYSNAPIYMGEFGVSTLAAPTDRCNWIQDMVAFASNRGIPWAYWDVKNWNNSFGIFQNKTNPSDHSITKDNLLDCFKSNMGLYPCNAPVLTNTTPLPTSVDLSWSAITNSTVSTYMVEYKLSSTPNWLNPVGVQTSTIPYTLGGLIASTKYDIRIKATCSISNSTIYSNDISITTGTILGSSCDPPTPSVPSRGITANSAILKWLNTGSSTSAFIVEYFPISNPSNLVTLPSILSTATSVTLTGLLPNTTYQLRMRKVCGMTLSNYSTPITFTTLTDCYPPDGLNASNITTTTASISWLPLGGFLTAYLIEYKPVSSTTWASVQANNPPLQIGGLVKSTCYNVRIKTLCNSGTTSQASEAIIITTAGYPCNAPTGITVPTANITLNGATVTWANSVGATTYTLEYSIVTSATPPVWMSVTVPLSTTTLTTSYTLGGLTSNTNYQVRVKANCTTCSPSGTISNYSATVPFKTLTCGTPTTISLAGVGTNYAKFTWVAIAGMTTYLEYAPATSSTYTTVATPVTPPYLLATGLTANTCYKARLKTVCGGTTVLYSANLPFTTTRTCAQPTSPSVTISNSSNLSITASWTAAAGVTSYVVEYKPVAATTWMVLAPVNAPTTSTPLIGLASCTAYQLRVKAVCTTCNSAELVSAYSPVVSFTTFPTAVSNLATTTATITNTSAQMTWTPTSGTTSYIEYALLNSMTWIKPTAAATSPYNLTGLSPNTCYRVRLRTVCGSNTNTVYSSEKLVTTTGPCNVGMNYSVSYTKNTATLTWYNVGNVATYQVFYRKQSPVATSWSSAYINGNTAPVMNYVINGLLAATTYEVYIRTTCNVCANTTVTQANNSDIITFTTLLMIAPPLTDIHTRPFAAKSPSINRMDIAPNPATDKFNVLFALATHSAIELELTDVTGKVLRSEKLSLQEGHHEMDIRQLPSGVYFVRARINQTELLVRKVIK